jgi:L-asparaginase
MPPATTPLPSSLSLPLPGAPSRPLSVVACGGTIAMAPDHTDAGTYVPAGRNAAVVAVVAAAAGGEVAWREVADVDSADLTVAAWPGILAGVRAAARAGGVVVTHGTDTLAWTAGMLAAAGPWPVPVVVTAANTPLGVPGSDAPTNLAAAARLAADAGTPGGVYVAFAGRPGADASVFAGGFVYKAAAAGQAFAGRGPRLGLVAADGAVVWEQPPPPTPTGVVAGRFDTRVAVVRASPFGGGELARLVGSDTGAVVVELYGGATAPPGLAAAAGRLVGGGVDVWACPPAPVDPAAAGYASTVALAAAGVTVRLDCSVELASALAADGLASTTGRRR